MSRIRRIVPWLGPLKSVLALLGGVATLSLAAGMLTVPRESGGPMNLHLVDLFGAMLLGPGVALMLAVPPAWWQWAWPLAGLATILGAGPNFWRFPPMEADLFALHAGVSDPSQWPQQAGWHVMAFAPVGLALAAARRPPLGRALLLGGTALAVAVSVMGFGWFAYQEAGWVVAIPAAILAALSMRPLAGPALRVAGGQAAVLLALCLALGALRAAALQ
ncbi:hypothetical protein [Plastoroseomonas arctica]|uniref:Uncharacterized protein n=1 Tax=Plastoroseomonas arctica TaxID=1509237 RepID=A0AAF1K312_9PROT|nr:hypothetical protein [Plastoroseomonas arctica]MBR0655491.1 hypothetical protein [Plastoroseomonas arctica]